MHSQLAAPAASGESESLGDSCSLSSFLEEFKQRIVASQQTPLIQNQAWRHSESQLTQTGSDQLNETSANVSEFKRFVERMKWEFLLKKDYLWDVIDTQISCVISTYN